MRRTNHAGGLPLDRPARAGSNAAFAAALALLGAVSAGCGGGGSEPASSPPPPPRPTATPGGSGAGAAPLADKEASSDAQMSSSASGSSPCPEDMAFVDTMYCPKVRLHCLDDEYNKANHITICNRFAPGQVCEGKPRRQRFCIDKYEYPNKKGAHPPVMVDWYDAAGACASKGKRLCWESEWVSACEGPEKLPFPYGLSRDASKCNIDNRWLNVDLKKVYSPQKSVQDAALLWLDQSALSGAKEGCVSGFGVHDLTGNVDEWVNAEATYEKSKWAGLKGGAWGHVRNACRPMTTSHPPEFIYYFISFRCCADAAEDPAAAKDPSLWVPPEAPNHPDPSGSVSPGWTPRERGPNQPL